jgi:hypothetical protein
MQLRILRRMCFVQFLFRNYMLRSLIWEIIATKNHHLKERERWSNETLLPSLIPDQSCFDSCSFPVESRNHFNCHDSLSCRDFFSSLWDTRKTLSGENMAWRQVSFSSLFLLWSQTGNHCLRGVYRESCTRLYSWLLVFPVILLWKERQDIHIIV